MSVVDFLKEPKVFVPLIVIVAVVVGLLFVFKPAVQVAVPQGQFDPDAYCAEQSQAYGVQLVYNASLNACVEVQQQPSGTTDVPAGTEDPVAFCQSKGMTFSQVLGKCISSSQVPSNKTGEQFCAEESQRLGIPLEFIPSKNSCEPTAAYKNSFCIQNGALYYDLGLDTCICTYEKQWDAVQKKCVFTVPQAGNLTDSLCSSTSSAYFYAIGSIAVNNGGYCTCPANTTLQIINSVPTCVGAGGVVAGGGGAGLIPSVLTGAAALIGGAGNWINSMILTPILNLPSTAGNLVSGASTWLGSVVSPAIQTISNIPSIIVNTASNIASTITNLGSTAIQTVSSLPSVVIGTVSNTANWLYQNLTQPAIQTVTNLPSVLVNTATSAVNTVLSGASWATQQVSNVVNTVTSTVTNTTCSWLGLWC
jgi:hypothetical protein